MWQAFALSPQEGQYLEQKKSNRTETLAAMATPDSVLGVSEAQTYATQLGQDKNFWDKNLIPLMRLIEAALDRSALFFEEGDDVVGLFDLSQVEALRAGLMEKIQSAQGLCATNLHMPPTTAYSVVGLEIDSYVGDDVCLVPMNLIKVEDAIEDTDLLPTPVPEVPGVEEPEDTEEPESIDDEVPEGDEHPDGTTGVPDGLPEPGGGDGAPGQSRSAAIHSSKMRKASKAKTHRQFLILETRMERTHRTRYRQWIRSEKSKTLSRFATVVDPRSLAEARRKGKLDMRIILPGFKEMQANLTTLVRPLYPAITESIFEFSLAELGIPTFSIDDEAIASYWNDRMTSFTSTTPKTVMVNLQKTLSEGIQAGESLDALKARIASVYDLSANAKKVLQVARTETAGLMNGVRRQMFTLQEFTRTEWSNSQDERVRPDHKLFGSSGPQSTDFNYMALVGGTGGTLEYPGDTRAPASQVINCRCIEVPVE